MDDDVYHFALRDWQENPVVFVQFFQRQCQKTANRVGYVFDVQDGAIEIAHQNWAAQCLLWKKERVEQGTKELSHLKILAILLHEMVSVEWVKDIYDCDPLDGGSLQNRSDLKERIRACIRKGRGNYLAFQFVIQVVNWFEQARRDRSEPFVFRLTPDLEHDFMVYLTSEAADVLATFLILKALYARQGPRAN